MAGRSGKPAVAREQWSVKCLRKCDVDCIISREIMAQIPDARQKKIVRMPLKGKSGQHLKSGAAMLAANLSSGCISTQDLRHFGVDQMRRVQPLLRIKQLPFDSRRSWRAQQHFEQS